MNQIVKVNEYDEFREKVDEIKGVCNFIPDVTTSDGYEKSKRVSLDIGKVLTSLEKTRIKKKADSIAFGKLVDFEAKAIREELEVFQLPHKEAYKELDNLKKEREATRKANLEMRVETIRSLPEAMRDSDSEGVKMALESLQQEGCLDFYEYTEHALKARNASKSELSNMYADKLKAEKDAVELAELRRKQAEQKQNDREERIAREASEKAEREAEAAKQAEQVAIEQASEAVRQREAADKKAKIDAELAEQRRIAAEEQAKRNTEAAAQEAENSMALAAATAKKQAETAAINARNAEILRQQEKEAEELAGIKRREANNRHVGSIRKAVKESLIAVGLDEAMAKKVVLAIHNKDIPNVTIKY